MQCTSICHCIAPGTRHGPCHHFTTGSVHLSVMALRLEEAMDFVTILRHRWTLLEDCLASTTTAPNIKKQRASRLRAPRPSNATRTHSLGTVPAAFCKSLRIWYSTAPSRGWTRHDSWIQFCTAQIAVLSLTYWLI